jgi:nitrite reductase/ring-hydroxylating ferredoxin subunit
VQGLIEQAIGELAPEVTRIEVEGAIEEHSRRPTWARLQMKEKPVRWIPLDGLTLPAGTVQSRQVAGQEVVLCQLNGQLYAYYSRCPACAASLGEADLNGDVLRCRSCGQRYAVRQAGRGLDSAVSLIPLPVLWKAGTWQIAMLQVNQM